MLRDKYVKYEARYMWEFACLSVQKQNFEFDFYQNSVLQTFLLPMLSERKSKKKDNYVIPI